MERVYQTQTNCCGCSLCREVCPKSAISMQRVGGFSYPVIDEQLCVDCGLCRKRCSFLSPLKVSDFIETAYAAKHKDTSVVMKSSSGGLFTALSDYILSINGTVYGADYDAGMKVVHRQATTASARDRMRGAKYVQSDISDVYKNIGNDLKSGNRVLFTGTPCQVAAVQSAFPKAENLYTVDIICHGVPSADVWEQYVSYIEKHYGKKLVYYKFRDKTKGWRGYAAKLYFDDGSEILHNDITGSFIELFRYDVCLRPSCTQCPYASLDRVGDLTIGDFWGIEDVKPDVSDNKGISAVMVNSEKGKAFLQAVSDSLLLFPCSKADIARRQPNLYHPSCYSNKAESFQHDLQTMSFEEILKKYTRVGFKRRIVDFVKKIIKRV